MSEHRILRLGHQGDGIADGPVYAPLTLPGELVSGVRDGTRLTDLRIVTSSPDRVAPPCRHFKSCGGCRLQHGSDRFVADWKMGVLRNALTAQGLEAEFLPIATSPGQSRRRATFAARRGKKGAMTGFHARASDTVIDIPDCQLLHPDLLAARPVCDALAMIGASRKQALDVAVTLSGAGLDVTVSQGKPLDGPLRLALAGLAEQYDLARLAWGDETVVTRRAPVQRMGRVQMVPPPGAFLQATEAGQAALLEDVARITRGARRIVDLFAGCGTFALPLAEAAEIHAVEGDPAMVKALDAGWRLGQGLKRVTTEARDLFRRPLLPDELRGFDAAVIDPPRAGAEAQVAELARARVPVIAYVSCNPVTFARDARQLVDAGYGLGQVRVVDQFRWSPHIELVAGFVVNSG